jgi:hypothetical protein
VAVLVVNLGPGGAGDAFDFGEAEHVGVVMKAEVGRFALLADHVTA